MKKRRRRRHKHSGCDPRTFDKFYARPLLGMDEVGTGCIAGPICAAGVVLPHSIEVLDALVDMGLRDSKDMTPLTRDRCFDLLKQHAAYARAVYVFPRDIERDGQGPSLDKMYSNIIATYRKHNTPGAVLIDGNDRRGVEYIHQGIVAGDQKSLTISAASVWAKVSRDRVMIALAKKYPGYGLENHKGYAVRSHMEALEKLGVADVHRRNTRPVKRLLTT
jgi:ribonuclease HII